MKRSEISGLDGAAANAGATISNSAHGRLIIDEVCRLSRVDELEHVLSTVISPQRLVPSSRGSQVDSIFGYRGQTDLGIFTLSVGREMEVELVPDPSDARMAVVTTAIGSSQFDLGRDSFPVSQSQGVVFSTYPARSFKFLEDTETYTLVMNRRKIAECCANLLALPIEDDIRFDTGFDLTTLSGQSWLRLMHYAEAELAHPQSFIRQVPAAWKQFEQTLMTGLLLAHRHDYSDALLRPQAPVAPYYVKRAEAFMEAHFSEPLSLADIAAYSQVSARSLQTGFQNFRNMTPMAFLRSTRLQHAHRALLLSDPATTTVTQIAMLCGFTHLGEFAASYRRAFGEPPSRTLLKATRR